MVIYCPNHSCQAANPETNQFCQVCRSPLPHRYLWAVGTGLSTFVEGDLLGDRYQSVQARIFLDTKPGLPPEVDNSQLPRLVIPYLHLSGYPRHIPRPHSLPTVTSGKGEALHKILLLEESAIVSHPQEPARPQLLPALMDTWPTATALTQLNWLWQIAQLWQPLHAERVLTTLITPDSLRIEGANLRILELHADRETQSSAAGLIPLGQVWQPLSEKAQSAIAPFLNQLCQQLKQGIFHSSEQLIDCLNQAIALTSQGQQITVNWATYTDRGPTRQRNEDACYPASGTVRQQVVLPSKAANQPPPVLLIVCDGIGGHQGGDVASKLAIDIVESATTAFLDTNESKTPAAIALELEKAIYQANDEIARRNDREGRQAQERMGTTLVMALVYGSDLYLAHIGDSRAYQIGSFSCRQVTLDDDVAAREARLGYSLYRQAIHQPGTGSLVQALGMTSSKNLYPTVQRLVLDEDMVILLCSDGLSDNDQVETFWPTELLPVLEKQRSVADAGQRLVQLANTRNGHDNVTIGLIDVSTSQARAVVIDPALAVPQPLSDRFATETTAPIQTSRPAVQPSATKTEQPTARLMAGVLALSAIAGTLALLLVPTFRVPTPSGRSSTVFKSANLSAAAAGLPLSLSPTPAAAVDLAVGAFVQISQAPQPGAEAALILQRQPGNFTNTSLPASASPESIEGAIPSGSILQAVGTQVAADQTQWVRLRVCSIPSGVTLGDRPSESGAEPEPVTPAAPAELLDLLQPGEEGWIQVSAIAAMVQPLSNLGASQRGVCIS
ncbi:MAG: SpoIIE family protein phosphatase [Leptolyngbyaceae cyanobacterium SL_1_1]|nr:SpoIIE family protein phosphatase [Leptolyngbyaceae cyanobacterium RM1_1_2]NJO09791.1 SpoIIE family protein phosphatase [Leptolyngbyaceae cyanobacterium SL_1_1]